MLGRRFLTSPTPTVIQGTDQDDIAGAILSFATQVLSSDGNTSFLPGSYLPLQPALVNPDGTGRPKSGTIRDRTYVGGQILGTALADLAAVQGGFDFDCQPYSQTTGVDLLRIWFPQQGVERDDVPLVYGSTVSKVTRSTDSGSYGNYWRVLGNAAAAVTDPQLWADDWSDDANDITAFAGGLWMGADQAASVTDQTTLAEQAAGDLALYGQVIPTWAVTLRPGAYRYGFPNMGDTCPLVVQSGRLNLDTTIRVLGLTYTIGDDGAEDVTLTVGRPTQTLGGFLSQTNKTVADLVQRETSTAADNPVGCILAWTGPTPPQTWAWADGSSLTTAAYPELFNIIGYTYGGSGASFNLPDLRSRTLVGASSSAASGLTARTLGAVGGAETVALTAAQGGAHSHDLSGSSGTESAAHAHATAAESAAHTHAGTSSGESATHVHNLTANTGGISNNHNHNVSGAGPGTPLYAQGIDIYSGALGTAPWNLSGNDNQNHTHPVNANTGNESAGHDHTLTTGTESAGHTHGNTGTETANHSHSVSGTSTSSGTGAGHENMPPWLAVGWMIRVLPPWRPVPL
jgi:microcystin-dependent protein